MAIIGDVEVQIVSTRTGEALVEYDNPDPDAAVESMSVEKYIQVATDEEFHIVVTLHKGFNYRKADGVRITYDLDGDMIKRQRFCRRPERIQRLTKAKILKIKDVKVEINQTWKCIGFSFGSVEVDEENHTEKSKLENQLRTLGSINVKIERAKQYKCTITKPYTGAIGVPLAKVDKELLAKSISHTIQPSGESPIAPPSPLQYSSTRLGGEHGKPLTVKFLYRSHLGLQTLGCIPRTPSPIPVRERAPADVTEEEHAGEMARIMAELQDLSGTDQTLTQADQETNKQLDEAERVGDGSAALVAGSSDNATQSAKRVRVKEEEQDSRSSISPSVGFQIKRRKLCN